MKKKFMLLVIASIMIVTFVSCEGDIFQSISDFMGGTSTNVLIDGEIVSVPTGNIDDLGDTLGGTTTANVTPAAVVAVRDSVEKILKSTGETKAAKELLKKPVLATEIPADVQQAMTDLAGELGLGANDLDIVDKGDLAVAILLKDLKDKKAAMDGELDPVVKQEKREQLVKDARVVVEFVKKASPIGDLDVTGALTGLLEGLIDERAMSRMVSRDVEDDFDADEVFEYVEPIFTMFFNIIDMDSNGIVTSEEVKKLGKEFAKLRNAYETMGASLEGSSQATKTSDLVNYLSSVLISSNNRLIPTTVQEHETIPTTFATLLNLVKDFVDSEVTDLPDPTVSGSDWYFLQETYLDDWADSFFDYLEGTPPGSSVARYTTIFDTVLAISGAIPDNAFITGELEDILADLTADIEEE